MPRTILIIDDEPDLIRLLDYNLTRADFLVLSAREGEGGVALARRHAPDLIILDVMMPGLDGFEVVKRFRQDPATARIPILMLTAKAEESDRVVGLELGADDYVTKPFSVREVISRIRALLRRTDRAADPEEVLKLGTLTIDSGRHQVTLGGKHVDLTLTEFNLLRALAERPGRVMSREDLISLARGEESAVFDRTVDVHMVSLRRKLGKAGGRIETVRGIGYRLKE